MYSLHIDFHTTLMCELSEEKRSFLIRQHRPDFMVRDMHELALDDAYNVVSALDKSDREVVPHVVGLDVGIPCVSRTPQSSARAANVNCVQQKRAATGEGWSAAWAAVVRHNPSWVIVECVKELGQKCGDGPSDSEYILAELASKGYWGHCETLNAKDYGSAAPRIRMYWAGIQMPPEVDRQQCDVFFTQVLSGLRLKSQIPVDRFVTLSDDKRKAEAASIGFQSLWSEVGERQSKRCQEDLGWRVDHKRLFECLSLSWPVKFDVVPAAREIRLGGLLPREREAAYFFHVVWAPAADIEFLDINVNTRRLALPHLEYDENEMATLKGTTPWHAGRPPTLTGSAKVPWGRSRVVVLHVFVCGCVACQHVLVSHSGSACHPCSVRARCVGPDEKL